MGANDVEREEEKHDAVMTNEVIAQSEDTNISGDEAALGEEEEEDASGDNDADAAAGVNVDQREEIDDGDGENLDSSRQDEGDQQDQDVADDAMKDHYQGEVHEGVMESNDDFTEMSDIKIASVTGNEDGQLLDDQVNEE